MPMQQNNHQPQQASNINNLSSHNQEQNISVNQQVKSGVSYNEDSSSEISSISSNNVQ